MGIEKYERESFDSYKNYVNQLESEYRTTFQKIEVYINGSSKLNSLEKNNCLLQVLDTFLSGQEEEKPVRGITGTDLKKYCDDMIYGETIYIYKASRIFFNLLGALVYVSFIYFFSRVFEAIHLKDSSLIFNPMNFGIGEIMLAIGYMCIPKVISLITRSYYEDPVRCKKVRKYTNYVVLIFILIIYTLIKDFFQKYVIIISFSNVILILIYLTIISAIVWLLTRTLDYEKLEKRKNKHLEFLNKQYEKHLLKCEKRNKKPLEWNEFLKKKVKENSIFTKLFFVYGIIFLIFVVLLGRGMLIEGKIDAVGITLLIIVSFIDVVMVGVVREGKHRNKQLIQIIKGTLE